MGAVNWHLVEDAGKVLKTRFKKNAHHTATALIANDKIYTSVQIDTKGFDVCSEPIAISKAIDDGANDFEQIVCVTYKNKMPTVINPCGNCRQILLEFTPSIQVIVKDNEDLKLISPDELLPVAYSG